MPIIDGCRSCCSLDNRFCCPRSVVYYFNIFIHEKLGTLDLMVSYHSMVSWYGIVVWYDRPHRHIPCHTTV